MRGSHRPKPSRSPGDQLNAAIAAVYDAAVDQARWPEALQRVVDFVGNAGTHLFLMDEQTGLVSHTIHVGMPDKLLAEYNGEVITECPRYANACRHPERTILYDYQHIEEGEIDRNEYYDWLQTKGDGIRYYLGGRLRTADGVEGFQSLAFRKSEGHSQRVHIERFRVILPHVERAIQIGQRLGTWNLMSAASIDALDRLGHGVVFLDVDGHIVSMNGRAEQMTDLRAPVSIRDRRLVARDAGTQTKLDRMIGDCIATHRGDGRGAGGAVLAGVLQVTVTPLKWRPGALGLNGPAVAVLLKARDATVSVDAAMIQGSFGLTAAEARLAQHLVSGRTLQQAAALLGVSQNTVRSQLKSVFEKAGVNRQADLVRVMTTFGRSD